MRDLRRRLRRTLTQLMARRSLALALSAVASIALLGVATPPPQLPPPRPLTQAQMRTLLPKVPLHTVFRVEVNKLGQVTAATPTVKSPNAMYNLQTYGNALQAFIRTTDGRAESGVYQLAYDYDPKTLNIRRRVALVHLGGTDPNKRGAALVMIEHLRKQQAAAEAAARAHAHAAPSPHPTR